MKSARKLPAIRFDLARAAALLMIVLALDAVQPVCRAATAHKAIELQGLHAYADRESVPAGETIRFHVSSRVPYRFGVSRLGLEVDDRASDKTVFLADKESPARVQPIHPGSYVRVKNGLPADAELTALTLECWVRPWKLTPWQGILTQHDYPDRCGYGLFLDAEGRAVFSIGSGGAYDGGSLVTGPKLNLRQWHHLVGVWDAEAKIATIWVDGKRAAEWQAPDNLPPRKAGPVGLRIGAYSERGGTGHFFDGDIAMPAIYTRALAADEIAARLAKRGLEAPDLGDPAIAAFWPLDEERGSSVADASGNRRDGQIVNLGTWMIGGPSFDGGSVGRYDKSYDPRTDLNRGHGLRLASDDLYDCGWAATEVFRVPKNARSGIYAAWFGFELEGMPHRYPVTFVVNKAKGAPKAPLVLMCSTTTWRAYGGTPFAKNVPDETRNWPTGGQPNDPSNPPAYCFYRDHAHGQPTYKLGLRMPWPVAGPGVRYSAPGVGYSHLMRGERFTHVWLEKQGYDFDVITNLDLHRDPVLLDGYKALIINGHDEYWSSRMYDGLDRYLQNGGTAAVLSGNTMFWRISVDDELGAIECRKFGPNIGGRALASVGEIYHSADGKRGSLMRNCGHPPWRNIGLECSGWWGGADNGLYAVKAPTHFLFREPEQVGFADRVVFGGAKSGHRRACGHEGDIRLSSYAPPTGPVPAGAFLPKEPAGIETIASLQRDNARVLDYFARFGQQKTGTLVDMIYWERPQGGTVFNAGAIGFGWALDADPKLTKLLRNVLHHLAGVTARTPYDPEWLDPGQ